MGKSKNPKKQQNSEKFKDFSGSEMPRKFKMIQRLQNNLKVKTVDKKAQEKKPIQEELDSLRKSINLQARKETRRYKKNKEYFSKKQIPKIENDDEIVLRDEVRFGEQATQPPKITVVPRQKSVLKTSTTKKLLDSKSFKPTSKIIDSRPVGVESGPGRKVRLRDLAEADKRELLKEREQLISIYRSKHLR